MKSTMDKGIAIEEDKQWFVIGHLRHIIVPPVCIWQSIVLISRVDDINVDGINNVVDKL